MQTRQQMQRKIKNLSRAVKRYEKRLDKEESRMVTTVRIPILGTIKDGVIIWKA